MSEIIFLKSILVSFIWTIGWIIRFTIKYAEPTFKNISILAFPWVCIFVYIIFFWWG